MAEARRRKKKLRSVLLVSAVSAVACGGQAVRDDDGSGPRARDGSDSTESRDSWDVDEANGEQLWDDDYDDDDCCSDDEILGAGAGNYDDGPGGYGGQN